MSSSNALKTIQVNDREYDLPQMGQTFVGLCFDGTCMDYIQQAMEMGQMPNLVRILKEQQKQEQEQQKQGHLFEVPSTMPSFTNPNNVSIQTGVTPKEHGICGNYYYEPKTQENIMMTSPTLIRKDSIFAEIYNADPINTKVTIVTSKDKLKSLLLHQLADGKTGYVLAGNNDGNTTTPQLFEGAFLQGLYQQHLTFAVTGDDKDNGNNSVAHNGNNNNSEVDKLTTNSNIRIFSVESLNRALQETPTTDNTTTSTEQQQQQKFIQYKKEKVQEYVNLVAQHLSDLKDIPTYPPGVYDWRNSAYCLQLGYALYCRDKEEGFKGKNIFYLTTTDYVQHQFAPGSTEANALLWCFDEIIGKFTDNGAIVGFTADHGMNYKTKEEDGEEQKQQDDDENETTNNIKQKKETTNNIKQHQPDVLYISDELDKLQLSLPHRTILPITDPYIAHHGALGGYATIYINTDDNNDNNNNTTDDNKKQEIIQQITTHFTNHPQIDKIFTNKHDAAKYLHLPIDRIGDIILCGTLSSVFGTRQIEHDLSKLHAKDRLRSHGSEYEAQVPLFFNRQVLTTKKENKFNQNQNFDKEQNIVHNYDLFYYMLNCLDY